MADDAPEPVARRRAPWRFVGHAAVTAVLGALVTFAVVGRGDGDREAGVSEPTPSNGVRSGVAGSAARASAAPTEGSSLSPRPTATPPELEARRLTFDDLPMGALEAPWAVSSTGVEVVAFPNAVDRGLRIGTRSDGAGSGSGRLCVSVEGIGAADAGVRLDLFSPEPLRPGRVELSLQGDAADELGIDLADLGDIPSERWVRIDLRLAGDGISGEARLVDAPDRPLGRPDRLTGDARPQDADRLCLAAMGTELIVDDLLVSP